MGGGITGACAAAELSKYFDRIYKQQNNDIDDNDNDDGNGPSHPLCDNDGAGVGCGGEVVVFDQGRRGPGGRASHRSVDVATGFVLPDDEEFLPPLSGSGESSVDDTHDGPTSTTSTPSSSSSPTTSLQFDHGCQFLRADTSTMKNLVQDWLARGWVAPWRARIGCLTLREEEEVKDDGTEHCDDPPPTDFFGVPSNPADVYIGVGGMHLLPRRILNANKNNVVVRRGTRVRNVRWDPSNNKWGLDTVVGDAAYHDTKEKVEEKEDGPSTTTTTIAGTMKKDIEDPVYEKDFDAVIFTDISSSSDAWHRASAGIPDLFRQQLPMTDKVRIPLFSCMIALSYPIAQDLPFDAFTVTSHTKCVRPWSETNNGLWFAAVSHSKPGFPPKKQSNTECDVGSWSECWTLISTPSFAVQEIKDTTMRDPMSGTFKPQEDSYLNSVPGPALAKSFFDTIRPYLIDKKVKPETANSNNIHTANGRHVSSVVLPEVTYLQAQRWGSGLPLPRSYAGTIHEICGTEYASTLLSSLVFPRPETMTEPDYVFDDDLGLYYAGDFTSHRNPGFEAAALSGLDVANHIIASYEERHGGACLEG